MTVKKVRLRGRLKHDVNEDELRLVVSRLSITSDFMDATLDDLLVTEAMTWDAVRAIANSTDALRVARKLRGLFLSHLICVLVEDYGYTQEQVAEQMGVTRQAVHGWYYNGNAKDAPPTMRRPKRRVPVVRGAKDAG